MRVSQLLMGGTSSPNKLADQFGSCSEVPVAMLSLVQAPGYLSSSTPLVLPCPVLTNLNPPCFLPVVLLQSLLSLVQPPQTLVLCTLPAYSVLHARDRRGATYTGMSQGTITAEIEHDLSDQRTDLIAALSKPRYPTKHPSNQSHKNINHSSHISSRITIVCGCHDEVMLHSIPLSAFSDPPSNSRH